MKIFVKRPLSLILCIMLGGFSLFIDASLPLKITLLTFSLLLFLLTFVKGLINDGKRIISRLCLIAFAISIILAIIWSNSFYPIKYHNKECKITAMVTDVSKNDGYTHVILKTQTIDGGRAAYKTSVYLYNITNEVELGDIVECTATVISTGAANDDNKTSYNKDGISAILDGVSDFKVTDHKNLWLRSILISARNNITDTLIKRTNLSTGGFMTALLIGVRDYLDAETALSFRRIGISHILALSGMHLSIITLALERLLSALKISKKPRIIIAIIFTLLYMSLAGFTPSITRSGIMLITYYSLFLLARSRDSFTSLCISVALIVIVKPYAIFDISLWLSALATLGIVTAPIFNKYKENIGKLKCIIIGFSNYLVASVFAIGATVMITSITFKQISILSIISTLIFSPVITAFMYLSVFLLIFGGIIPFGGLMIYFSDAIKELSEIFARPSFVLCSTNSIVTKALIALFTVMLIGFLVLSIKKKGRAALILCLIFLSIYLACGISTLTNLYKDDTIYIKSDTQDCVLIKNSGSVYLIATEEVSRSYSSYLSSLLVNQELTLLDELVLTSYSEALDNNIQGVINYTKTALIRIPYPKNEREDIEARRLAHLLSRYGTSMSFYSDGDVLELGSHSYRLLYHTPYSNNTSECAFMLSENDRKTTYFTQGAASYLSYSVRALAAESDVLILGVAGADNTFNLKFASVSSIVCGKNNLSESAENYYQSHDTKIKYIENEYIFEKGRE